MPVRVEPIATPPEPDVTSCPKAKPPVPVAFVFLPIATELFDAYTDLPTATAEFVAPPDAPTNTVLVPLTDASLPITTPVLDFT